MDINKVLRSVGSANLAPVRPGSPQWHPAARQQHQQLLGHGDMQTTSAQEFVSCLLAGEPHRTIGCTPYLHTCMRHCVRVRAAHAVPLSGSLLCRLIGCESCWRYALHLLRQSSKHR
jgi:hypothetical protein